MSRRKNFRKMSQMPAVKGFQPYGPAIDTASEAVVVHFEEYEAFRLCDYLNYSHQEAAHFMGVSRPTLTRIYASVRRKIAKAFAEARPIVVEGGMVFFEHQWYACSHCSCKFHHALRDAEPESCPLCGAENPIIYNPDTNSHQQALAYCGICETEIAPVAFDGMQGNYCPKCRSRIRQRGRGRRNR